MKTSDCWPARSPDHRRHLLSFGLTLCLYAGLFGAAVLAARLIPDALARHSDVTGYALAYQQIRPQAETPSRPAQSRPAAPTETSAAVPPPVAVRQQSRRQHRPEPAPRVQTPRRATAAPAPVPVSEKSAEGALAGSPPAVLPAQHGQPSELVLEPGAEMNPVLARIKAAIDQAHHYPRQARRMRKSGRVLVGFVAPAHGGVIDVHIIAGSGEPLLDRAALDTVRRAGRQFPVHAQDLRIRIPLIYDYRLL